jgi:hypothetical protein
LESGEAIRSYNAVADKRGQYIGQNYEQFHLDVGEVMLDVAKELKRKGKDLKVLTAGDKDVEELLYSEIAMEPDTYVLRAHPVSILPDTPAGKIETFQKLAPAVPALAPWLLSVVTGIPDLDHAIQMADAPNAYADQVIGMILEKGVYTTPDNIAAAYIDQMRDTIQRAILVARMDKVPPARIALLDRFLNELDGLQERADASMQAPPMGLGVPSPMPGQLAAPPQGNPGPQGGAPQGPPIQAPTPAMMPGGGRQ